MTVSCKRCGQTWERDPALDVVCPTCNAGIGQLCKRPSEHAVFGAQPHASRDRLAMQTLEYYGKCQAPVPMPEPKPTPPGQGQLFELEPAPGTQTQLFTRS